MVVEEHEDLSADQSSLKVDSILDRRKQLKRQRRYRLLQSLWRTSATLSLTIALGWGLNQPEWKIRSLDQVSILGNTQLSTQTLERLLPLTYPASLIRVEPQTIAQQLKRYAHVEQVVVSRQLFPPQVSVVVQERPPIATIQCSSCVLVHENQTPFPKSDIWLLDAEGIALPLDSYPELKRTQSLPSLKISGYLAPHKSKNLKAQGQLVSINAAQQKQLKKMLPLLLSSPVTIERIDLKEKTNLKLMTSLGSVHLSQFDDPKRLKAQIETLDKLRSIPNTIDMSNVQSLDLSDPSRPTLTLKDQSQKTQVILPGQS